MASSSLAPHCRRNRPPGFLARRFSHTIGPEAHAAVTVFESLFYLDNLVDPQSLNERPKARAKHR